MPERSNFELTPGEWVTLRRLLRDALDRAPQDRAAFVDGLSGEHSAYRPRLQALLAHARETTAPILHALPKVETDVFAPWPGVAAPDRQRAEGQRVGPYRLLRRLGAGGMGSVWLAERTDMLQGRPIALKLPHESWRHAGLAERLAREREILATLDHPHIARLYDAGVAEDGQPYLALEYVEGEPLDRYCSQRALAVPARLRLMLQVLDAVAHAHARLVVHRDLKPSNILVGADGQAKLLDFGIAKLLAEATAVETELTQVSGRALTLHYASPEQIAGRPIGTASDIYSLGVVLYELLADRSPHRPKRDSRAALEEAILHEEPARPSSVVADARLRRALRGDLDTIVIKSLAKAPAQRYATVDAMAADIRRHLASEPVLARPPGNWYRARKFVARNRLAVGAAAAVAAAVATGTTIALVQTLEARAQSELARAEAASAERVAAFLEDLFSASAPENARGRDVPVREIVDAGVARLRDGLADDPLVRARMYRSLGYVYHRMGQPTLGRPLLESAVSEARALGVRGERALAHALVALAELKHRMDDPAGAEADLRESIAIQQRLQQTAGRLYGVSLNQLALVLRAKAPDEALRLLERNLATQRARLGDAHPDTITSMANIGSLQLRMRSYAAARDTLVRVLPLVAQHLGDSHPLNGVVLGNLAFAEQSLGNAERSIELLQREIAFSTKVMGPAHPELGVSWLNLARATAQTGDDAAAVGHFDRALEIFRRGLGESHWHVLSARNARAQALYRIGRTAEAKDEARRALAVEPGSPEGRRAIAGLRFTVAEFERRDGRAAAAFELARAVYGDPHAAPDRNLVARAHIACACALLALADAEGARDERDRAAAVRSGDRNAAPWAGKLDDARFFACANESDAAGEALAAAVAAGLRDRSVLAEPEFHRLRGDAAVAALRPRSAGEPATPRATPRAHPSR